jgi:hypothetical protein
MLSAQVQDGYGWNDSDDCVNEPGDEDESEDCHDPQLSAEPLFSGRPGTTRGFVPPTIA